MKWENIITQKLNFPIAGFLKWAVWKTLSLAEFGNENVLKIKCIIKRWWQTQEEHIGATASRNKYGSLGE